VVVIVLLEERMTVAVQAEVEQVAQAEVEQLLLE
jgi:hypothetical protein